jgi:cell division protein FtsA
VSYRYSNLRIDILDSANLLKDPKTYAAVMGLLGEARMQRLRGRKFTQQSGNFKASLARMKEWFMH